MVVAQVAGRCEFFIHSDLPVFIYFGDCDGCTRIKMLSYFTSLTPLPRRTVANDVPQADNERYVFPEIFLVLQKYLISRP